MPFQLCLYRAPEHVGPINTWDREHRQSLGTRLELRAALVELLPGLCWNVGDRLLFATGPFANEEHAVELSLHGKSDEVLLDFLVYASPPVVRVLMSGLNLNYCFAVDSGELRYPFEAGERWPSEARDN